MIASLVVTLLFELANAGALAKITKITGEHCVRCHNEDGAAFDLTHLPDKDARQKWMAMWQMVDANKMPPPPRAGQPRTELDPMVRSQLLDSIAELLGDALDGKKRPGHLSLKDWRAVVHEVASMLPTDKVDDLVDSAFRVEAIEPLGFPSLTPLDHVAMERAAYDTCKAIAEHDVAAPRASRRFQIPSERSATLGDRAIDKLVVELFTAVHARTPTPADRADGKALARTIMATDGARTAWEALCTTYLTGPRLLYMTTLEAP